MQLSMELKGFYCNSWPILTVKQDCTTVFEQPIITTHTLLVQIENKPFTIGMENKSFGEDNIWDTTVDDKGNIIADKYIEIKTIALDDVDFQHNLSKLPYSNKEHGPTFIDDQIIRFNGYWDIDVNGNPYNWIIDLNNSRTKTRTNTSYFSDYESHGNFSAHQELIDKITKLIHK